MGFDGAQNLQSLRKEESLLFPQVGFLELQASDSDLKSHYNEVKKYLLELKDLSNHLARWKKKYLQVPGQPATQCVCIKAAEKLKGALNNQMRQAVEPQAVQQAFQKNL